MAPRRIIRGSRKNAASFGGDPARVCIGGHSSGGDLCGVALKGLHLEMAESLGNPFGPNGRAALALMRLGMG